MSIESHRKKTFLSLHKTQNPKKDFGRVFKIEREREREIKKNIKIMNNQVVLVILSMMILMVTMTSGQGLRYSQQMFDAFDDTSSESCVALSVSIGENGKSGTSSFYKKDTYISHSIETHWNRYDKGPTKVGMGTKDGGEFFGVHR